MKKNLPQAILFAFILVYSLCSKSCANTSTPPMGGAKDTIPPVMVSIEPPEYSVNFPTKLKKSKIKNISFRFNEYVVVKEAQKNIFLSPPQTKAPKYRISGKSVKITFEEALDSNTTYTLDLGAAIADNNEGNPYKRYVYTFSTGKDIDSLYTAGSVVDAVTLLPLQNITIALHNEDTDSTVFLKRPNAATKTDIWGYFTLRNIKNTKYRVYAIEDINNNNKYEPSTERIAFLDTLYSTDMLMFPENPDLQDIDVKDTLACAKRPVYIQLKLFKEISERQFLKNKERPHKRMMYITFSAPYPQIDSMGIREIPDSNLIKQFNITKDSLCIWVNDQKEIPDTLHLDIRYHKTNDSLQVLEPTTEKIILAAPKIKKTLNQKGDAVEVKDTSAKYEVFAKPENVEQEGIIIEFEHPLIKAPFEKISLNYINARQQEKEEKINIKQDSLNIRRYIITPQNQFKIGNEYILSIPKESFYDINNLPADSLVQKFTLPNNESLSTFTAELEDVNGSYIVELVNEKRDKVLRRYDIKTDCKLVFPYLKEGNYSLRITEDRNKNGIFDTGNLLKHRQPEKVLLYKMGADNSASSYFIEIHEMMELEQTINIKEMFK